MATPWKHPKTGVYYFRRAVPAQLRPHIGKREIKSSLHTRDPNEAKTRWAVELLKCEQTFASAGKALEPETRERLAREWIRAKLDGTEATRLALVDAYDPNGDADTADAMIRKADIAEAYGAAKLPHGEAKRAMVDALHAALLPGHTMSEALEGWLKTRPKLTAQTVHEWRFAVAKFGNDRRVEEIRRKDITAFVHGEIEAGRARGTVKKYVQAIASALGYAVDMEWREANPARDVKVPGTDVEADDRLPYRKEHLKAIFSGPVHTGGETVKAKEAGGAAAFWLPVLALYTGARMGELAQLRADDVRQEDGVWFLDLNVYGEGQRLKNKGTRRKVPLHPDIHARFLAFVPRSGPVFPDMVADEKSGKVGKRFSRWWARYMDQRARAMPGCGLDDRRLTFHSFRHTFKDACREAKIPAEVHDRLTGHSGGNVGRRYGNGYSLAALNAYVREIQFPVAIFGKHQVS